MKSFSHILSQGVGTCLGTKSSPRTWHDTGSHGSPVFFTEEAVLGLLPLCPQGPMTQFCRACNSRAESPSQEILFQNPLVLLPGLFSLVMSHQNHPQHYEYVPDNEHFQYVRLSIKQEVSLSILTAILGDECHQFHSRVKEIHVQGDEIICLRSPSRYSKESGFKFKSVFPQKSCSKLLYHDVSR